jgi:hypothetical protein
MADRFTGFWEDNEGEGTVATTFGPLAVDALLERLRERLEGVAPGVHIRIDLIAWADDA